MEKPRAVSVNCLRYTYSTVKTGLHNVRVGRCTAMQLNYCTPLLSKCSGMQESPDI